LLDLWYNQIALKIFQAATAPSAGRRSHRPHMHEREYPMIDSSRRTVLANGAAVAAANAVPQVVA
jgi:hypothetical protein